MEEARKLKVEEIKEKPSKIKKEEKVRDYTDIAGELTGLVKENYLVGLQTWLIPLGRKLKNNKQPD